MKKIIVLSILLLLLIGITTFFYFRNLQVRKQQIEPFTAIPLSASLVFDLQNSSDFFNLYRSSEMINDFLGEETLNRHKNLYRFFLQNANFKNHFDNKRLLVSIHCINKLHPELLYMIGMEHDSFDKVVKNANEQGSSIHISTPELYKQAQIYGLIIKNTSDLFYLSTYNGLLIGSYNKLLVQESIDRLIDPNVGSKTDFKHIRMGESPNVQASVFVNYKRLPELLAILINKPTPWINDFVAKMAQWSVLNLNYKKDAIMFNGSTTAAEKSNSYLTLFTGQEPQKSELSTMLPADVAMVLSFNLSNYSKFKAMHRDLLLHQGELPNYEKSIATINRNYGIDFENDLGSFLSHEFGLIINSNGGNNVLANQLAFVKVTDTISANDFMEKIPTSSSKNYKTFELNHVLISNFLPLAFGSAFSEMRSPYYVMVQNYMVFGNNIGVLQQYIDDYLSMKSLEKDQGYQDLKQYVSDRSNVNFYLNFRNSREMLLKSGSGLLSAKFKDDSAGLNNFQALSIQFSSSGTVGQFFTDFYMNYRPGIVKTVDSAKIKLTRAVNLDAPFTMQPQLLTYSNQEQAILVQDDRNTLYYISKTGRIQWKVKLAEPVLSSFYAAVWKGKACFVFNTSSRVYATDVNGKALKGFPITVKKKSITGLSVFDYDNNGDYRIFIPANDGSIFAYTLEAKPVQGWNPRRNVGRLKQPMQLAKVRGNTFLFAYTKDNRFWYFGRKGEVLSKGLLDAPVKNKFFAIPGTTQSNSRFVSSDSLGNIKTIFFDGRTRSKTLGSWSGTQFFGMENITGSDEPDYVFIDKNQLFVYESSGTLVYNHNFESDITTPPQFFNGADGKSLVGITSSLTSQIFLFGNDGTIYPGFPLMGTTPFEIVEIANNKVLLVGDGRKLLMYSLN